MIIIQEVGKAAQFGVKREHSGLLPQNLVKLGSRKAPINENVLVSLFSSTKGQTQAMKYGLESETMVVKEFREVTGPQVINVVCLVHPNIYWMGCSVDGIIYDPNENPSVGILEIKFFNYLQRGVRQLRNV